MRFPRWFPPALVVAIAINALMLILAGFLAREEKVEKQDLTALNGVNMISLAPEEPEAEQEVAEPQKPPEQPQEPADVSPDLFQPDFSADLAGLAGAGDAVAINLGGGPTEVLKTDFVFESYELDQAPRPISKAPPVYPMSARQQGIEGVVQIKILVREDGSVGEVIIMDARPKDIFEDAVLNTVPRWRFEPGVIGGKKVTSWVVTALHFKLS